MVKMLKRAGNWLAKGTLLTRPVVYDFANKGTFDKHPKRAVFGLPHNYRLEGKNVTININSRERRASPLFIHIHRLENGKYLGILSLLPAKFLKGDDNIAIWGKHIKFKPKNTRENVDYEVITKFLDRIVEKFEGKELSKTKVVDKN